MLDSKIKISILISTKNRSEELKITLDSLKDFFLKDYIEVVVYDDGSSDNTYDLVKNNYPKVTLLHNEKSKGYIYCRNRMLNESAADYAISLDDDANFLSDNIYEVIINHFQEFPKCAVIATRIFWGKEQPYSIISNEKGERVKSFVGCGHIWNLKAWKTIPNYPEWFVFYGEEDFASYELFKKDLEIHYVPDILVHHRVEVKSRKKHTDYIQRTRRSLRSGWYLILMFYPISKIPRIMMYSLLMQIKNKVLKGDYKAGIGVFKAIMDLFLNSFQWIKNRNGFSTKEFKKYSELSEAKIYWRPEK